MKKWIKSTFVAILMMSIATMQVAFAGDGDDGDQKLETVSRNLLEKEDKKSPHVKVIKREFCENGHCVYIPSKGITVVRHHALTEIEVKGTRIFLIDRVEGSTGKDNLMIVHNGFLPIIGCNFVEATGCLDCNMFYLLSIVNSKCPEELRELAITQSKQRDFSFDRLYEWVKQERCKMV